MKVIVAPDKFKGSLTSFEACKAIASGVRSTDRQAEILEFPMADGGDGFAAVMKYYLHSRTMFCSAEDPLGRPIRTSFELNDEIAIVELASASGLTLLDQAERDPTATSTYGTGLTVQAAIDAGAKEILLGIGGSATNDAGAGILAAMGFQLLDRDGNLVKACGGQLLNIRSIVPPPKLPAIKFVIACDVKNVLYGEEGAAYVYAPQKGASPKQVELLDKGLRHFAGLLKKDVAEIPGAGAAGGIAAGLMGFFEVRLTSGVQMVMDKSGVMNHLIGGDLVITGEGKIDDQTLFGKVVSEIGKEAARHQIPVIAFCGISELKNGGPLHLQSILPISPPGMPEEEAMARGKELLKDAVAEYLKHRYQARN